MVDIVPSLLEGVPGLEKGLGLSGGGTCLCILHQRLAQLQHGSYRKVVLRNVLLHILHTARQTAAFTSDTLIFE